MQTVSAVDANQVQQRRQPAWVEYGVVGAMALLAILVLRWANVGFRIQLQVAALMAVATLAGAAVIVRKRSYFPDPILFWLTAYLIGVCFLAFSAFVLSQRWAFGGVTLAQAPGRLWIGVAVISLVGIMGLAQLIRAPKQQLPKLELPVFVLLFASAILINTIVHLGFYDNLPHSPAQDIDHRSHIVIFPGELMQSGMPEAVFLHRGLELLLIQVQGFLSEPTELQRVAAYKVFSLAAFFSIVYSGYAIGHYGFGLRRGWALLAGISSLVFCAIAPTFWDMTRSAYLGFYSPSATLYHNATQVFSHGMAATGLALLALTWNRQARLFAIGGLLMAFSLILKPAFLFYFAPALLVLLPLQLRKISQDVVLGYLVIVAAFAAWFLYPTLTGALTNASGYGISPFNWSIYYIPRQYPFPLFWHRSIVVALMVVCSFAFPLATGTIFLIENRGRWRDWFDQLWRHWDDHLFPIALALFFIVALAAATLLIELDEFQAGNQTWGLASAYLCVLPFLIMLASRVRHRLARWLVWGIFTLHVLSTVPHLYRLLTYGKL